MSQILDLHLLQIKPLEHKETIIKIKEELKALGYEIKKTEVAYGKDLANKRSYASFDDAIEEVFKNQNVFIHIESLKKRQGFPLQFIIHMTWVPSFEIGRKLSVSVSSIQEAFYDEISPILLELGKRLYSILSPAFGFADLESSELEPTEEQLKNFKIYAEAGCAFWANFFSSKFVERIGRKKLEKVPVGKIEQLSDGGILYTLGANYHSDESDSRKKMKEYLGL